MPGQKIDGQAVWQHQQRRLRRRSRQPLHQPIHQRAGGVNIPVEGVKPVRPRAHRLGLSGANGVGLGSNRPAGHYQHQQTTGRGHSLPGASGACPARNLAHHDGGGHHSRQRRLKETKMIHPREERHPRQHGRRQQHQQPAHHGVRLHPARLPPLAPQADAIKDQPNGCQQRQTLPGVKPIDSLTQEQRQRHQHQSRENPRAGGPVGHPARRPRRADDQNRPCSRLQFQPAIAPGMIEAGEPALAGGETWQIDGLDQHPPPGIAGVGKGRAERFAGGKAEREGHRRPERARRQQRPLPAGNRLALQGAQAQRGQTQGPGRQHEFRFQHRRQAAASPQAKRQRPRARAAPSRRRRQRQEHEQHAVRGFVRIRRGVVVIAHRRQVRKREHGNEYRAGRERAQPAPRPPEHDVSQRQNGAVNQQVGGEQDRQADAENLEEQPVGAGGQRPVSPGRLVKEHPAPRHPPGGVPLRPGIHNGVRPLPPRHLQKEGQQPGQERATAGFRQPRRPYLRGGASIRLLFRAGYHRVVVPPAYGH